MRVLTVGNMYPPHSRGGYEVVWQSAAEFLSARGHDVRVLTTDFEVAGVPAQSSGPSTYRELSWYWKDDAWPRLSGLQRLSLERRNTRTLELHVREHMPDVVCWWAMGGMSLSLIEQVRRLGLPSAFVVCDDWMLYAPQMDAWLRVMRRFPHLGAVLGRATGVPARVEMDLRAPCLFPSETLRGRALASDWGLDDTYVCHQGVDKTLFPEAQPRPWSWDLLYVGRLDPRKGVDLAVKALALLPAQASLTIVGTGSSEYLEELRRLVRSLKLEGRVSFAQHDRSDLASVYGAADAVLFPVRWVEPWGLVPLEAMAVGTPVIATGRGGSGEYLRDGKNSLIFDPDGGALRLANAVIRLGRDEKLRARIRKGGFETTASIPDRGFDKAVETLLRRALLP